MDSDKTTPDKQGPETPKDAAAESAPSGTSTTSDQQAPADALSRTPEDLEEEHAAQASSAEASAPAEDPEKKLSPLKRFFRKVNVYFLIFGVIVVVVGAIAAVNFLNSQKDPVEAALQNQALSQDTLKQLANTDATVGNTSQTLTIQGNAVISGQALIRGALNVAGAIQAGGNVQAPGLTVSGDTNLGNTQINTLQVATNTAIQGSTTLRDLSVAGSSNFSGNVTAAQITVTRLVMSGNASLEVPNHLGFTGPSPSRTVNNSVVGSGGSASVDGSDTTGTVNINTGNSPTAGCFIRINFNQSFPKAPHVIISPVGSTAGQISYYVDRNTGGFSICTTTAAAANQSFAFDYFVTS